MMVASNPDVELVSEDDDKGVITVRDKKTGETMTVDLDEAQQGRLVFKQEGKGEVSIEAKGDESKGSIEVKTSEGVAKFGSGSVDRLPDWMPAYPGAQSEGSYSAKTGEGESGGFHFTTKDSPEKVISFYEDNLKQAGMRVTTNILHTNSKATGGMASAETSNKKRTAYINVFTAEEGTQVTVGFEIKR